MKIRRATMAVVAAGALALAGCTSDTGSEDEGTTDAGAGDEGDGAEETSDDTAEETSDGMAEGDTSKTDLGDVQTMSDTVSFSSGAEEYNAYNSETPGTNSTYNAVVNNQLLSGFWYWGTDGTVYPNEWFGSYEQTSEDPLTVEYTI
ncbi:ABC transporter family substrate-binding protein, partial [Ornithinimicrobium sp. LYQ92]